MQATEPGRNVSTGGLCAGFLAPISAGHFSVVDAVPRCRWSSGFGVLLALRVDAHLGARALLVQRPATVVALAVPAVVRRGSAYPRRSRPAAACCRSTPVPSARKGLTSGDSTPAGLGPGSLSASSRALRSRGVRGFVEGVAERVCVSSTRAVAAVAPAPASRGRLGPSRQPAATILEPTL